MFNHLLKWEKCNKSRTYQIAIYDFTEEKIHIYAVKYYLSMIFYDSLEKYNVLQKRCIKNIALYIHLSAFIDLECVARYEVFSFCNINFYIPCNLLMKSTERGIKRMRKYWLQKYFSDGYQWYLLH